MTYEKTGSKQNKDTGNNAVNYTLKNIDTGRILWHLVTRHKNKLITMYAVILSIMYFVPFLPDALLALI